MTTAPRLVLDAPLAHLRWSAAPAAANARPPVLLLHGVGGGRGAWMANAPSLAAAGFEVLAVDAPGYGDSTSIEPCTLAGMARAVLALIDALALGPAIVVGHSMGGMVAQELVALAPQQVAGLVLASTSPAFGKPGGDWQQAFLQDRFAPLDAGLGMAGLAAQLVPAMAGAQMPAQAMAAAQALMAGVPEAGYRAALTALVNFDQRAGLAAIHQPTLVITGAHDRTAAAEVARRMAERIPGARLAIVPGASHLLPMGSPVAFNAVVLGFLLDHWPGTSTATQTTRPTSPGALR